MGDDRDFAETLRMLLTVFGDLSLTHRPQLCSTDALREAAEWAEQRPTKERDVGDLLRSGLFVCISRILNMMPTCLSHANLDPGLPALRVGGLGAGGGGGGSMRGGGGGELLEDLFGFLLDYLSGLGADAAAEHRDERQGGGDRENEREEGGRQRAGTAHERPQAGEELYSHGVSESQCLGAALSAVNNLVAALLLTPSGSLPAAPGPLERAGEQVFLRVCTVYSAVALRLCQSQRGGVGGVGSEDLLLLALEERCLGDAGAIAQYCRGVAEFGLLLAVLQTKFSLLH